MARTEKFKVSDVIAALENNNGMVYLAAKQLNCSHVTVYAYAKRHPTVQQTIDAARGSVVDTAELALFNAILNGEHWAIAFALKTIGKNRGYSERTEVTGADGQSVAINFTGNVNPDDI